MTDKRQVARLIKQQETERLLGNIADARKEVAAAEELVHEAITEARMYNITWDAIADLFPVSRNTLIRIYDPGAFAPDSRTAQENPESRAMRARAK